MNSKNVYGGDDVEWNEYASGVVSNWSHNLNLDEAIKCFELIHDESRTLVPSPLCVRVMGFEYK